MVPTENQAATTSEEQKESRKEDKMSNRGTQTIVVYLISASSIAILSVFLLPNNNNGYYHHHLHDNHFTPAVVTQTERVWPGLEVSWKTVVATVVGFVGSALGTVGGVGAGGIFVPMLNLVVGFDAKSAAALSKCMIMGAAMSSVWYNLRVEHPTKEVPIIDYDLALLFQPMLMLGITIGVSLSVVFPYWLITVLIIILFLGTSSRSFFKATLMWREETILKMEEQKRKQQALIKSNCEEVVIDSDYVPLVPREEKSTLVILRSNIRWRGMFILILGWCSFLLLQILKNHTAVCSPWYWIINIMQFPVAIGVYLWESVKLYKESKKRRTAGNAEFVCEACVEWNVAQLLFCSLCGVLGGTVGGLLGSGGGFILGPLLLEFGVIPQVASATATFVMMFSSSLSVVEFYFLDRFPIPYAVYLLIVSVIAGFWGQFLVRKLVLVMNRASVIVFTLSTVIFVSALIMGIVGIETSIEMINHHEYMGFLSLCEE